MFLGLGTLYETTVDVPDESGDGGSAGAQGHTWF